MRCNVTLIARPIMVATGSSLNTNANSGGNERANVMRIREHSFHCDVIRYLSLDSALEPRLPPHRSSRHALLYFNVVIQCALCGFPRNIFVPFIEMVPGVFFCVKRRLLVCPLRLSFDVNSWMHYFNWTPTMGDSLLLSYELLQLTALWSDRLFLCRDRRNDKEIIFFVTVQVFLRKKQKLIADERCLPSFLSIPPSSPLSLRSPSFFWIFFSPKNTEFGQNVLWIHYCSIRIKSIFLFLFVVLGIRRRCHSLCSAFYRLI